MTNYQKASITEWLTAQGETEAEYQVRNLSWMIDMNNRRNRRGSSFMLTRMVKVVCPAMNDNIRITHTPTNLVKTFVPHDLTQLSHTYEEMVAIVQRLTKKQLLVVDEDIPQFYGYYWAKADGVSHILGGYEQGGQESIDIILHNIKKAV